MSTSTGDIHVGTHVLGSAQAASNMYFDGYGMAMVWLWYETAVDQIGIVGLCTDSCKTKTCVHMEVVLTVGVDC